MLHKIPTLATALLLTGMASGAPPVSTTPSHTLKLRSYVVPPGEASGLLASVRINGGPALRLLVDSGAESLTLTTKAAIRSGLKTTTELDLAGAGAKNAKAARSGKADLVQIGDLSLNDVPAMLAPV